MINSTMPALPAIMGQSIITGVKQISSWSFAQFMSAPVQNLALGAVGVAMAMSASNALYWQSGAHPAPLFAQSGSVAMNVQNSNEAIPVLVPPHPLDLAVGRAANARAAAIVQQQSAVVVPSVPTVDVGGEVTNEMLSKAQEVLTSMGLFSGTVDGFYGPLTAQAIRDFEALNGLTPKGALETPIIVKIINAPLGAAPSMPRVLSGIVLPTQVTPQSVPIIPAVEQVIPAPQLVPDLLTQLTANVEQASVVTSAQPIVVQQVAPVALTNPQVNKLLIEQIQNGLAKLGFYNSSVDGIAGESTAKAIRQFENFLSYPMTGDVNEQILQWLQEAGAYV